MPDFLSYSDRRVIESYLKIGEDILLGKVKIDQEKCIGCELCVKACAANSKE